MCDMLVGRVLGNFISYCAYDNESGDQICCGGATLTSIHGLITPIIVVENGLL